MPSEHGLRLNEQDGAAPVVNDAGPEHDQRALVRPEPGGLVRSRDDDQLLAQERVLGDELAARSECVRGEAGEHGCWPHRRANRGVHALPDFGDGGPES